MRASGAFASGVCQVDGKHIPHTSLYSELNLPPNSSLQAADQNWRTFPRERLEQAMILAELTETEDRIFRKVHLYGKELRDLVGTSRMGNMNETGIRRHYLKAMKKIGTYLSTVLKTPVDPEVYQCWLEDSAGRAPADMLATRDGKRRLRWD